MKKKNYWPLAWFILGFGIFVFTRMSKLVPTIPISILIAPIFILRFSRTQPVGRGNLLTLFGFYLSLNIGLWWLYESNTLFNAAKILLLAVLYSLPFMIYRPIREKFKKKGISSGLITLTFPVISTAIHFLSSLEGFFEGTVQLGKFVFGPVILQQLLSLFGICGFIFIASWFASIVNYLWENNFDWDKNKKTAILFVAIILAIFLYGAVKTISKNPEEDTVKVAAILLLPEGGALTPMDEMWVGRLVSPFERTISRIESLTRAAASNDVKIVSFQEFTMMIDEEDERWLKDEFQRIAKENKVYLSISYAYYAKEGKGENTHLFMDNNGKILLDYPKRYVSGLAELDLGEARYFRKGPEMIQWVDTPYGRIAVSICRDLEMANFMRQAGRANVDIMLSSAWEQERGLVIHSSYLRTIEHGFSLLRPSQHGITIAVDYNGNILNQMDFADPGDGIMYAELPTQGVNTLYTQIGDVLGWVCVVGLLGLVPLSIVLRSKPKKETT
ncbi:MAG: nitrilase-related carbon-nitrogen hydrolase [Anaerolineales bacterium]